MNAALVVIGALLIGYWLVAARLESSVDRLDRHAAGRAGPAPTADDETGDLEQTSGRQTTKGISIDAVEARLDDIDRKLQQIMERLESR